MKKHNQIPEFIFASIQGKASAKQKQLTGEWLNIPENQKVYTEFKKINSLSNDLKLFNRFNLYAGKIEVHNKLRRLKVRYILTTVQKVAAILLLPILIGSIWFLYQNYNLKKEIATVDVIQEISSQPGVKSQFLLPDGTEVWLNAASKIKFPAVFSGDTRKVELDGEAYFKVFKDKTKPFIVKAHHLEVTALGTAFNLCAYDEDNIFFATLEEGKVRVDVDQDQNYILSPDEQLLFDKTNNSVEKSEVDVTEVTAWKDGKLIFNETPFHEVVLKMNRWFNVDIQLEDQSIANYRYTATFIDENLKQVLELLKLTAPIEYSYQARTLGANNEFTKEQIIIRKNPDAKLIKN